MRFLGQPVPSVRLPASAQHSVPARTVALPLASEPGSSPVAGCESPAAAVWYTLERLPTDMAAQGTARCACTEGAGSHQPRHLRAQEGHRGSSGEGGQRVSQRARETEQRRWRSGCGRCQREG